MELGSNQTNKGFDLSLQHHTQTHTYTTHSLTNVKKHRREEQRGGLVGFTDTQPSMLPGISWKRNVRSKFWWFRSRAIRITYRISLRPSSLWEPRHPLLKVVCSLGFWLKSRGTRGIVSARWRYLSLSLDDAHRHADPAGPSPSLLDYWLYCISYISCVVGG